MTCAVGFPFFNILSNHRRQSPCGRTQQEVWWRRTRRERLEGQLAIHQLMTQQIDGRFLESLKYHPLRQADVHRATPQSFQIRIHALQQLQGLAMLQQECLEQHLEGAPNQFQGRQRWHTSITRLRRQGLMDSIAGFQVLLAVAKKICRNDRMVHEKHLHKLVNDSPEAGVYLSI